VIESALRLSLMVALGATLIVAVVGSALGWILARTRLPGRDWIDAILMLPLVLPPTVTGYYLIALLGRRGLIGETLHTTFGISIPFTPAACLLAAVVMSLPLMIRAARVAFEGIDRSHERVASTLGLGTAAVFLRVSLPLARRGLLAGLILSFARALGEFGATLMLAGNIQGHTQTLPLAIYEALMAGEDRTALTLSLLLTAISCVVIVVATRLGRSRT
jgi:molybdate transport system permease protein